jgi:hypothetical protein
VTPVAHSFPCEWRIANLGRNRSRYSYCTRRKEANVDKFVDVKAPAFNIFQQGVPNILQTIQFKASKFHTFSIGFNMG